jgi:hypothetical protein
MIMKKKLLFVLAFFAVTMQSCLKDKVDYTIPENLVGTTWKYIYYRDAKIDYNALVFTSTTTVELRTKEFKVDERLDHSATYSIEGKTITIVYDGGTRTGTISKTSIGLDTPRGTVKFVKQ